MIVVPLKTNSNRENQYHPNYINLRKSGLYFILNILDNKYYIGSAINFTKRRVHHYDLLKNNKHFNIHLQRAFNKYGEDSFKFIIVEECLKDKKELEEKEALLIKVMMATNTKFGYNKSYKTSSRLGLKNSEYQRKRTIEVWTGRKHSEESKRKMSESRKLYLSSLKNN